MLIRTFALFCVFIFSLPSIAASSPSMSEWFNAFKQRATPAQMYNFLHAMPKGGDIHHHLSGAGMSE
ncbi:hypothetical protein [Alteromonas genovensis]